MQLRNFIFLLSIPVLIATGCNKKLDVKPENEVTPEQITTAADVKGLIAGTYSTLQSSPAFGENYNTITELLFTDDDMAFVGTFDTYADFYNKEQVAANTSAYAIWAMSYRAISGVNLAIDKLGIIEDEAERTAVGGEAKFLRALVYFQLVNMYAKPYDAASAGTDPGVPIVTVPAFGYDSTKDKLPRASIQAVYDQIVKDATEAAAEMEQEPDVSDPKANRYAALALLSRVYLSLHDYPKAWAAADEVINSGNYELTTSFANEFNNASNTTEDIFAIQQTSQSNSASASGSGGLVEFYGSYPVGRGEIQVDSAHLAKYEAGDERGEFFYPGRSISNNRGIMTSKWRDLYKVIPVFRLAEMYLTRAEAKLHTENGPNADSDKDVNEIRMRAGLDPLTGATEEQIINERHLELAFEGEWFLTVKRLGILVRGVAPTADKMVFPIPQREIDIKSALPQNPGY